jgi:hypothetical protein
MKYKIKALFRNGVEKEFNGDAPAENIASVLEMIDESYLKDLRCSVTVGNARINIADTVCVELIREDI